MYADDLAILAESEGQLVEKIKCWKDVLEQKGLQINVDKTKVMKCQVKSGQTEDSGKWPCSVCHKGVDRTPLRCP